MKDNFTNLNGNKKELCSCGKVCFDKKTAQTKRNQLEREGRQKNLRIYQCNQSDYFHLTKATNHKYEHKYNDGELD